MKSLFSFDDWQRADQLADAKLILSAVAVIGAIVVASAVTCAVVLWRAVSP